MPRVISYARFSSRKQAKGLSLSRQIEAAEEWCKKNGHVLERADKYKDEGRSAFSGDNAAYGELGLIQKKLLTGEIERGTILIVEALDRVTRLPLSKAFTLVMNLVQNGLVVVTLSDGKIWNEDTLNDLGSFMMSIVTLYRGHQESEYKSARLRKTFNKHRKTGSQQAFGSAPGWLSREDKMSQWVVDEEKADVVRRVFELSAAGYGSKLIAKKANEENWPVPTRISVKQNGWHPQLPGQILRNRAVLGELQHRIHTHDAHAQHWQGLIAGEPVKDYYPRIISDDLWNRSRASIRSRFVAKRRDAHYYNIFSGLMYCGHCGAPIQRKSERSGHSRGQLQCSDKLAGKTDCKTMAVNLADPSILDAIYGFAVDVMGTTERAPSNEALGVIEAAIVEKKEQAANLGRAISRSKNESPVLVNMLDAIEDEISELLEQKAELQEEHAMQPVGAFHEAFVEDALKYLYVPDDDVAKEKRAELHLKLSRLVDTIWLFAYDLAVIKYKDYEYPQPVALPQKQLPSRVKPDAKYHREPPPRKEKEKPFFLAYMSQQLELPEPRKSVAFNKKVKPLLLEYAEDEETEVYE